MPSRCLVLITPARQACTDKTGIGVKTGSLSGTLRAFAIKGKAPAPPKNKATHGHLPQHTMLPPSLDNRVKRC